MRASSGCRLGGYTSRLVRLSDLESRERPQAPAPERDGTIAEPPIQLPPPTTATVIPTPVTRPVVAAPPIAAPSAQHLVPSPVQQPEPLACSSRTCTRTIPTPSTNRPGGCAETSPKMVGALVSKRIEGPGGRWTNHHPGPFRRVRRGGPRREPRQKRSKMFSSFATRTEPMPENVDEGPGRSL
jgi:hypothetical protein